MNVRVFNFVALIFFIALELCNGRKTSAGQVPLGISRATGHAKATRLAGPRITPSHRLEEQEKLKNKIFKQVAWKERQLAEKISRNQKQYELDLLVNQMVNDNVIVDDDDESLINSVIKAKKEKVATKTDAIDVESSTAKRRPLFKKMLLKRRLSEE